MISTENRDLTWRTCQNASNQARKMNLSPKDVNSWGKNGDFCNQHWSSTKQQRSHVGSHDITSKDTYVYIYIYIMIQLRVSDLLFCWGHNHTNEIIFKVIGLVQGKIYGNLPYFPGLLNVYITNLKDPPFYIMGKLIMSIAMFQFANCKRQSQRVMVQWLMGLVWLWVDSHLWWVDDVS